MAVSVVAVVWLALAQAAAPAPAPEVESPRWRLGADVGGSLLSPGAALGVEGGRRLGPVWLSLRTEWSPWFSLQASSAFATRGSFQVQLGAELRFFDGRVRSALWLGTSTLLFRSALDSPGATGPSFAVLPAGFSLPLGQSKWRLRLEPLSFHVLAPSLSSIPLVVLQYRTTIGIEVLP